MDKKPGLGLKPLILKKGNLRILHQSFKDASFKHEDLCKEVVLYDTTDMYFLKGEYQRLLLVNRFHLVSKQSRVVAKYFAKDGSVVEKTSDRVTEVIGQEQFKTVFTALCSIIDQELKIRSLLSLLTLKGADKMPPDPIEIKGEEKKAIIKIFKENSCQTDEMRIQRPKQRKRIRKPVSPYIVPDMNSEMEDKQSALSPFTSGERNAEEKSIPEIEKKKPKRVIINVRKLNSNVLRKVTVQNKTSVSQFDSNEYKGNEISKNNLDPLMTGQIKFSQTEILTKSENITVSDNQIENLTILDNSNLTIVENEKGLTFVDNQSRNWTGLDSQNQNLSFINSPGETGSLCNLDNQKTICDSNLTDLGYLRDEYSNDSIGNVSALSDTPTNPEILTNPTSLLKDIDQHTKELYTQNWYKVPGTNLKVPYKPEDIFHIATKDNLQYLNNADKRMLLQHQLSIDYENCMVVNDEDGNLPIHQAVMQNDQELLVRLCIVLKMRGSSLDLPEDGSLPTPLQLAVETGRGALAACLLRHGACPLRTDETHRAVLHDAAEKDADLLRQVIAASRHNARKILYENEDLWKDEMETQSDEMLGYHLMKYMCSMYNKFGYNPLMLASRLGLYENVRILVEQSPNVNDKMPNCGNTALYLAVAAACNNSIELGNKSKVVAHYRQTIEYLLQKGADPSIDNNYSTNVHTLLQEFNNQELSMLIANKQYMQLVNKNIPLPDEKDLSKVMLVVDKDGDIRCKKIVNERNKKAVAPVKKCTDKKLLIVEEVILKPGNTASAGKSNVKSKNSNMKVIHIQKSSGKIKPSPKVVLVPKKGVKRKQDAPIATKQAKID